MIVGLSVIYYGYFAFFEATWNGQTPGKRVSPTARHERRRAAHQRLRRHRAQSSSHRRSIPVFYGVAIISVFFSKQNKRLGDFVAGTVVVHEKTVDAARPFFEIRPDDSAVLYDVSRITVDEFRLIETFLQRRDTFDPALRGSMAAQISGRIAQKLEVQVDGWPANEKFLEAVHSQYRATGRYRSS